MSQADAQRFAALLTAALYQIKQRETIPIAVIQDEIGYAMGRKGGSVVESWRKGGHMPQRKADVERLAAILVERGKLSREWLEEYLGVCGYGPERAALCERLQHRAHRSRPRRRSRTLWGAAANWMRSAHGCARDQGRAWQP